MWIGVVTLFPEMFEMALTRGVFGRAVERGAVEVVLFNPRDFTTDKHRTVDDRPYGGGPGMVMMVEPLVEAVEAARGAAPAAANVVLLSPQGERFSQAMGVAASQSDALILVCGRYEGLDERFVQQCVDEEWSIGDYVLTGGELPAMVVMDVIARHIPGTLGNKVSALDESHLDGSLDYPHYTRPETSARQAVPQELMSGDHGAVARYRRREALRRTLDRRPELLTGRVFDEPDRALLQECFGREP
jgi:tRNA (guanine37-N1)-methyltransferase